MRPVAGAAPPSERLHHRKDDDADHENGRYLIENSIELLRMAIAVGGEFAHASHKETMQSAQRDNQHQLSMQTAGGINPPSPCEPSAKHPTHHQTRRADPAEHAP